MVASEYGYTFAEFLNMTNRTLDIVLKRISVRNHNAHAVSAALHGHKIPLKKTFTQSPEPVFSQEEENKIDLARKKALERIMNRQKKRHG